VGVHTMIDAAAAASNPLVGSSRNTRLGSPHSSTPMLSLRFWPPESPLMKMFPTLVCWAPSRPRSARILSTSWFFCSHDTVGGW
jgi:hypothetical protein